MVEQPLVYARESFRSLIAKAVPHAVHVTSHRELVRELGQGRSRIALVDSDLLDTIDADLGDVAVIVIVDGGLDAMVHELSRHALVRNVVTTSMLATSTARMNLEQICERIAQEPELCAGGIGRTALLTSSNRRQARIDRLHEFFESHGIASRTVGVLGEIAEELIMNALYDAPAESGYFPAPVSRTEVVELPTEHACEISYGVDRSGAFVRLRDPFGSLTRDRLLSVLDRCARSGVALDESRGGAGLGMWRVFSLASSVTITVIPGRLTDVLVWVDASGSRRAKHAHTIQLFFPSDHVLDAALGRFAADHDHDLIDDSFTALIG